MLAERWRVWATRGDGSTKVSPPLMKVEAVSRATVLLMLDTPPIEVKVMRDDPNVEYAETGPWLVLDAAIAWTQPRDHITVILR